MPSAIPQALRQHEPGRAVLCLRGLSKTRARKPQSLCVLTFLWDRSCVARLCIGRGVDPMCQGCRCIVELHPPVFATVPATEMQNDAA